MEEAGTLVHGSTVLVAGCGEFLRSVRWGFYFMLLRTFNDSYFHIEHVSNGVGE